MGQRHKKYAELVWPEIANWTLLDKAAELCIDTIGSSPIEIKMYLALKKEYEGYILQYPNQVALLVNKKISEISEFLRDRGEKILYQDKDVDYEIDLFIYMNMFSFKDPDQRSFRSPFYIFIECDGHDYHEKTKEQAKKDKSKDRMLKIGGLDVIRFTGSEITANPDKCVAEIKKLIDTHKRKLVDLSKRLEEK